jgi:phospholipid/cholesterol/gamma-HCH transport system substrate-binding protein
METRKQLIMTGLFLVAGIFVVLATILMLGGNKKLFQKSSHLYVKFDQIQGLNQGAVISLAGLPIGNVDGFDFDAETNQIKVSLRIPRKDLEKINVGASAEIRTQGALGDKFIYITPGKSGSNPIADGTEIPAAKSTDLMAILSEKGNETEKVFDIINNVNVLTKTLTDENRLGRVMMNLDSSTTTLSRVALKAETAMDKFDHVMTKVDNGQGTLGALISDPSIHDQIKAILGGSQRKSQVKDMLRRSVDH